MAFLDDPVISWLVPDPASRLRFQRGFARYLLSSGESELCTTADGAAVALWLTVEADEGPDSLDERGREALRSAFGPAADRVAHLSEAFADRHPHGQRHLYLPLIGVLPESRGRGHGGTLLRHKLDSTGLPAYLEATSARGAGLYERYGFTHVGTPVHLPDGPDVYPMWRPATG